MQLEMLFDSVIKC